MCILHDRSYWQYHDAMTQDPFALVGEYHRNLPERIINYLHRRGIADEMIAVHRLGWNGQRITIPIFTREGELAFFKLAKDPEDPTDSPKMLTARGGSLELYGWEQLLAKPSRIIVCEGEFDRLVLETNGIPAVTATGGAGSFRAEWATHFENIAEVYLCFDRDDAGRRGALRVGEFLPNAKIIDLPEDVGTGGDVTDVFVRLGRTRDAFLELMIGSRPVPVVPPALPVEPARTGYPSPFAARAAALKREISIADVISRYVPLRPSGANFRGRCPLHEDHSPSLMVYTEGARFHCYGCGRHGDVIEFFMSIEHVSFLRALEELEGFRAEPYDRRVA